MDFYTRIASDYERIFPISENQKRFFQNLGLKPTDELLDIGCATGGLIVALSDSVGKATGIDLNEAMICTAVKRLPKEKHKTVRFVVMDMRQIDQVFGVGMFSIIVCMGNTLVHFKSHREMTGFLSTVRCLLKPSGRFIFQMLNYDRILSARPETLPSSKPKTLGSKGDTIT